MDDWYPTCTPPPAIEPVRRARVGVDGPTRGQLAGPGWRQTSWGLHVGSEVDRTPEQRAVEAAVRIGSPGMVTGWAALRLHGAAYFDGTAAGGERAVPVLLPHARRISTRGLLVTRTRLLLPEPEVVHGVPCAPPEVALWHELSRAGSACQAGVMVDMALAARVVSLDGLREHAASTRTGPHATYAVSRACPDCRSPKESEMLQAWEADAGFPRPRMNVQILDLEGRLVAVVDLLDDEAGVAGEYNGAAHRSRERQRRDEQRASDLRDLGLEVFTLVAGDGKATWLARMRTARRRALWLPRSERRWRAGEVVLGPRPRRSDGDATEAERAVLAEILAEERQRRSWLGSD